MAENTTQVPETNPMVPDAPMEPEEKPISRYLTFAAGITLTILVYYAATAILAWKFGLWFNFVMKLGLLVFVFAICFLSGIVKVAGKKTEEEKKSDKGKNPDEDIEAGFWGVVKAFDAPLSKRTRFLLPSGRSWLPPFFMEVASIDMREQAIDIPKEKGDPGFTIESLSPVDPQIDFKTVAKRGNKRKIKPSPVVKISNMPKFVPMLVKVRIRTKVFDPYLWYAQDPTVVERSIVTTIVQTMRSIATNGKYPGDRHPDILIESDLDLMAKKEDLGDALKDDVRELARKQWGIDVIDVIVSHLRPADPELVKIYQQIAKEMAERASQTIEAEHIRNLIALYKRKDVPAAEAIMYAMLSVGKTTLENFKGLGGQAIIMRNDKASTEQS